jgi:hypothetical protein
MAQKKKPRETWGERESNELRESKDKDTLKKSRKAAEKEKSSTGERRGAY